MDTITAFGIGALVFVFIVLLTAFSLKSTSIMMSAANKNNNFRTQELVNDTTDDATDYMMDDTTDDAADDVVSVVDDTDILEIVSE